MRREVEQVEVHDRDFDGHQDALHARMTAVRVGLESGPSIMRRRAS